MKVLGLSGSLRNESTNVRLLEAALALSPANFSVEIIGVLGSLPHFSPDLSVESDRTLIQFVDAMRECDGVLISSPVYAGGYPGTLKNALDWLVGTDAVIDKPFMMLSASNRVPGVQASLIKVLETMGGIHVHAASALVPLLGKNLAVDDIVKNRAFADTIELSLGTFHNHVQSIRDQTR